MSVILNGFFFSTSKKLIKENKNKMINIEFDFKGRIMIFYGLKSFLKTLDQLLGKTNWTLYKVLS